MSRSVRKELRLTAEMVQQIDEARGDVSFNRFVERALEKALGEMGSAGPATAVGTSAPSRASLVPKNANYHALAMERQQRLNKGKKT